MTIRRVMPLVGLLAIVGLALAQTPAKKAPDSEPSKSAPKEPAQPVAGSLEDTLARALKNSADIRAAEAKVRETEAELSRVRAQVATRAAALHTSLQVAKRLLRVAEDMLQQTKASVDRGSVGIKDFLAAQGAVEKARGDVEQLETELKSLLGEFSKKHVTGLTFAADGTHLYATGPDGSVRLLEAATGRFIADPIQQVPLWDIETGKIKTNSVMSTMADRVRKFLDGEVEGNFENTMANEVLAVLLEAANVDIPLRNLLPHSDVARVTLRGKLPVGSWIQAIEDTEPGIVIVVRDYGLLITVKDRVPKGAVTALELWKAKEAKNEAPAKK